MIHVFDADDWKEIWLNGTPIHKGHEIPLYVVVELLKELGQEVYVTEAPEPIDDDYNEVENALMAFREERIKETNA